MVHAAAFQPSPHFFCRNSVNGAGCVSCAMQNKSVGGMVVICEIFHFLNRLHIRCKQAYSETRLLPRMHKSWPCPDHISIYKAGSTCDTITHPLRHFLWHFLFFFFFFSGCKLILMSINPFGPQQRPEVLKAPLSVSDPDSAPGLPLLLSRQCR